jgi:transposase InsO family protein
MQVRAWTLTGCSSSLLALLRDGAIYYRRVHLAGRTTNPSGVWVTQQARKLSFTGLFERVRFLIHDRDSKFATAFDEVFRSEGIKVIHTPIRAPQANAYAERVVSTVRDECLDWLLILRRRHLEKVLPIYTAHYGWKSSRWTVGGSFARVPVGRG